MIGRIFTAIEAVFELLMGVVILAVIGIVTAYAVGYGLSQVMESRNAAALIGILVGLLVVAGFLAAGMRQALRELRERRNRSVEDA